MKVWARPPLRMLGGLVGRHFEYEDILACRDGELSRLGRWCVRIHLRRCKVCRHETELIEEDLLRSKAIDGLLFTRDVLNLPNGLAKLRRVIGDWEARRQLTERVLGPAEGFGEVELRRLEREFNIYLGDQATATLLSRMKGRETSSLNALQEAESVLCDFLGPGAAAAVAQRVAYTQLAGAQSSQGSIAS